MSDILQVSQEFLKIGGNKPLGALVLAKVEELLEKYTSSKFLTQSEFGELQEILRKNTGLAIHVEYIVTDDLHFGIFCPIFSGHTGNSGQQHPGLGSVKARGKTLEDQLLTSTVDLDKAKVTGAFTDIPFQMVVPSMIFGGQFTAEEITAGILHETGHAFFLLATLGEYTWLNYYLTDGMEVLLGKKPNKYKVEMLNYTYLESQVTDKATLEKLKSDPTEQNLRRAVLEACYKQPRNHLTGNVVKGAMKRDEQLADTFAMRLGFTRPLATFIDKVNRSGKLGARYSRKRGMFLAMEIFKVIKVITSMIAGIAMSPWTMGFSVFIPMVVASNAIADGSTVSVYDNPTERIVKMRRELVTQIKNANTSPTEKASLDEDLKVVDELLDKRNQFLSIWEAVGYVLAPGARRDHKRLKHEELLEDLLANNLFVQANRLRQHT